jgi:hypothetical protein
MICCNNCKISIRGGKSTCPLCGNILAGKNNVSKYEEIYPVIPLSYERNFVMRILIFISIVSIVVSYVIYEIFYISINWPMFTLFGVLSMWLSLSQILRKRNNVSKLILRQVVIVSALVVFWDWRIGWRGWSLDFAIPILCITAILVMYVSAKVLKLSIRDYIAYSFLGGLLGIIPILFILFNFVRVSYPSVISVAVSIIFLSAIVIFQGDNIKAEWQKRMHM